MPMGSRHRVTGLLKTSPRGVLLEVEDGGVFVLDTDRDTALLLGKRVIVEGVRTGFDRLDVEWLGLA